MPYTALKAWNRIGETGNKIESFTKVLHGPKEDFMDFLQWLTSAVNRMIPNSEARQIIIESLAFENANSQFKRIIRPLKTRSEPLEPWGNGSKIQSVLSIMTMMMFE